MIKTIKRLLADERVRFVIVGGANTVIGYGLFAGLQLAFGHVIGYIGSLYIASVIATIIAFVLHRRFTFRVTGNVVQDFLRFASVYAISLAINTAVLPILVEVVHLDPLIAQAVTIVITTLLSYTGHKLFSFRRKAQPESLTEESNPAPTDSI
jgi:putative flippase GtrA